MLPVVLILAFALFVWWLVVEFQASRVIRICLGVLAVSTAAYAGYLGGRLAVALEYSWVPKEHNLLAGSMREMEQLLVQGDTNTVMRAIAAYNEAVQLSTNEFGYYRASSELWKAVQDKR
jgi:hypothetical protein